MSTIIYIKDMDELIERLSDVSNALEGHIVSDNIDVINEVINEWVTHTREHIKELAD